MSAVLSVRGLTAGYPGQPPAVTDVAFDLRAGSTMGVIGPNGAGKSTLLKACLGLLPKSAGTVRFFGQPLAEVRRRVAYVPQRSAIDWDFPATALDVVLMGRYGLVPWYRRMGRADREAAAAALETVGLTPYAGRRISDLSGGQQQRVFLARALAADPALLILDEPLTGIDAPSEAVILAVLAERASAGGSVLMVHHDLASARRIFDHTLVLATTAVAEGPPEATLTPGVLARAYGGQVLTLPDSGQALILDQGRS